MPAEPKPDLPFASLPRWWRLALLGTLLVVLLHGCSTAPLGRERAPQAPAAGLPAADDAAEVERRWLQSWFDGTPVVIRRDDDELGIDVPREFSFAGNGTSVKPALGAVLDKVAESLRRNPQARLQVLAVPGSGKADQALVRRRAERVLAHLRSRGVAAARLGSAGVSEAAAVRLRVPFAAP